MGAMLWVRDEEGGAGGWLDASEVGADEGWNGGGGSSSYVVRAFPFAFDAPSLTTGAALYTPSVGDILIDGWVEIVTAWDGTTPQGDVFSGAPSSNKGIFGGYFAPLDMTAGDNVNATTNYLGGCAKGEQAGSFSEIDALTLVQDLVQANVDFPPGLLSVRDAGILGFGQRNVPARFATTAPIKVIVTQDGQIGGADPGATQGAAILYLITATPQ